MTYYLTVHRPAPWHVGPFPTHTAAQHWAETRGLDEWTMEQLWDPAEAGAKAAGIERE